LFPPFHNSQHQLNIATPQRPNVPPWLAMVSIVSMAGEELLTLELKDFDVAVQLRMEVSAKWRCVKGEDGKITGKGKKREKKGKKGKK
jgi:hypothetical protein